MLLSDYATKTEIMNRAMATVPDLWPIGIDYGFSSVKGISPNKIFCYPNCAVPTTSFSTLLDCTEHDILLKDAEGLWIIGEKAHDIISPENAMNYESEMYERNRYFSPVFRALMKVGLGIALQSNYCRKYNGEPIMIQTGLPPEYKELDSEAFKEALAGDYEFDLKIGSNPFRRFKFSISIENIYIMDQPMGSLFSAITDKDGKQGQAGVRVLKSSTLVFDPGFKTFDIYNISGGVFQNSHTFDFLGMHEIFKRTIADMKKSHVTNITILGMQDALKKGYITTFNRRQMSSQNIPFDTELEKNTREVCIEAIQKVTSLYNYLQNHEYLIVTGGTGNAWFPIIKDYFRNMSSLTILSANCNDTQLSNTYSNVRGYYYYLVGMLKRRFRK